MKRLLLLAFTLIASLTVASAGGDTKESPVQKNSAGEWTFEQVYQAEAVSQADLYQRGKKWVQANVSSDDNHATLDDADFSIVTTAGIPLKPGSGFNWAITAGTVGFKMHLYFKEGRFKYVADNIIAYLRYGDGVVEQIPYDQLVKLNNKIARFVRNQVDEKITASALKAQAGISSSTGNNNNW